ncbi:MAG: hypothetical protein AB1601_11980 [Planctomycetota bacterium]
MANNIAIWDGARWNAPGNGIAGSVYALAVFDVDGAGPAAPVLIAAGSFTEAGGTPTSNIAQWDGAGWSTLADGTDDTVFALTVWDEDDAGPRPPVLIAGGMFLEAGGVTACRIAKWDGESWSALLGGSVGGVSGAAVRALTVWDDDGPGPRGPMLVVGGYFGRVGSVTASNVAQFDGVSWSALGAGVDNRVRALTTWDADGLGAAPPLLVVGGEFQKAGGANAKCIAKWNGTTWSSVGGGVFSNQAPAVLALHTFDGDGAGPRPPLLIAGGDFGWAGVAVNHIAAWDGVTWQALAGGVDDSVLALAVFDADGPEPGPGVLAVGGSFREASGQLACGVAQWDAAGWSALSHDPGNGLSDGVDALTSFDPDGTGPEPPALFAGGVLRLGRRHCRGQHRSVGWRYLVLARRRHHRRRLP